MTQSRSECNNTNEINQISRQSKHNQDFFVFVVPDSRLWILKLAGLETVSEWPWIAGTAVLLWIARNALLVGKNPFQANPFLFQTCATQ